MSCTQLSLPSVIPLECPTKKWQTILLTVVVVLALLVAGIVAIRMVNQHRYFAPSTVPGLVHFDFDTTDPSAYPLDSVDGVTITPITGEHLTGFHLKPETRTRPGVTVSYGGSGGTQAGKLP